MSNLGLCAKYKRIIDIKEKITKQLCQQYHAEGVICPPSLEKGIFALAAIDNLDHNPLSSTANTAFYGTSISLFQTTNHSFNSVFNFEYEESFRDVKISLLEAYTYLK